jgi:signal transduction histidine kinase
VDCKKLHVLLVEDDESDVYLTRRALAQIVDPAYHVDVAASLSEAAKCLRSATFDVALLDLGLPESVGIGTLAKFRERCPESLPVIVLTNLNDEQAALATLDKGAQDFLVKNNLQPDMLSRAIRYALQRQQLLGQLQAANELLHSKNKRLSELYDTAQQFVDNVSHEFRTPLTVIREFTSIVRDGYDGPVTPKQIEHLDKVLHRSDDLALMVDDMLDISKLEAGLLGVWRRPCCVEEMVKNVTGLLRARATSKKISLAAEYSQDLPQVYCDEEKAQRVLINLAVNAVKFTPEGGRVIIGATLSDDGSEVVVSVTDSGPGICQSNLDVIFERFKQVETNLRSSTKGFGLGLNIAKELVQLNLGQICVESQIGAGSTFSYTLPKNEPSIIFDRYLRRRTAQAGELPWVTLLIASYDVEYPANCAPVIDEYLQRSVRANDFVLQSAERNWMIAACCSEQEYSNLTDRLLSGWQDYVRNFPQSKLPPLKLEHYQTYSATRDVSKLWGDYEQLVGGNGNAPPAGKTVLVVDDDQEVNACLGLRLEAAGFQVLSAFDGEQGLSAALSQHPDAVVLDVRMPNKDGLTMLRELRTHDEARDMPVVVLSASIRDQHRALEAGANYFVTKPYEPKEVLSAIESSMAQGVLQ